MQHKEQLKQLFNNKQTLNNKQTSVRLKRLLNTLYTLSRLV